MKAVPSYRIVKRSEKKIELKPSISIETLRSKGFPEEVIKEEFFDQIKNFFRNHIKVAVKVKINRKGDFEIRPINSNEKFSLARLNKELEKETVPSYYVNVIENIS